MNTWKKNRKMKADNSKGFVWIYEATINGVAHHAFQNPIRGQSGWVLQIFEGYEIFPTSKRLGSLDECKAVATAA